MLLEKINSPEDLKKLSVEQLTILANEIRTFLIEKLSNTGGHLAPNLGVVELTIALHYFFNSPKDRIIWDVGHQSYVHKILTGRKEYFDKLRQFNGLSGYIKRSESIHDIWEAGHSSTSLSAAMGMAIARDHKNEDYQIIPIIGDGAMTGGMALEALNHIGHEKRDMLIILNDNKMSIAPNVGAMSNYLNKIRTDFHYNKVKDDIEYILNKIPAIGEKLARTAERVKDSLKYLLVKGVLFEELGFTYLGPIDGHDIHELLNYFKMTQDFKGPLLLHVITKKGKGYVPAEEHADKYHGISPYKVESGEVIKNITIPSYTDIFSKTMLTLGQENQNIIAITAAMPDGTGLKEFSKYFPNRFIDVGIAEQHATTLAASLALENMVPVFAVYSTFLQRGYDQLIHDVCRQNLHVVFAIDRAGLVGEDGETHQGVFDIAYLRHIPNIIVMMPKDENELQHMLFTAVNNLTGPVAVRYPRGTAIGVPLDEKLIGLPIGKAEILRLQKDIAIIALGPMVKIAMQVADILQNEGIKASVINARFIKPLDKELLNQLTINHNHIVTIEEGVLLGGFGSSIAEYYTANGFNNMSVQNIGIPDMFIEHGSIKDLRNALGLTPENIAEKILFNLKNKQRV